MFFEELTRIPHLDPADTPESRGNAGEAVDSFFHPSRPLGRGHLIWRKVVAHQRKLAHEAGRTPIHPGNPGLFVCGGASCRPHMYEKMIAWLDGDVNQASSMADIISEEAKWKERGFSLCRGINWQFGS
jgi:hypothetical protein